MHGNEIHHIAVANPVDGIAQCTADDEHQASALEALPGRTETVIPVTMAASNLGPVLTAPLIGLLVSSYGSNLIPVALSVLTALLLLVSLLQYTRTKGAAAS